MSPSSSCDLIAMTDGRCLRIEVKTTQMRNGRVVKPRISAPGIAYDHAAYVVRDMGVVFAPELEKLPNPVQDMHERQIEEVEDVQNIQ